jgi:hypothetical protein
MKCREYERKQFVNIYTVKPVKRGDLWDKQKWPYKTGDLLREVNFI